MRDDTRGGTSPKAGKADSASTERAKPTKATVVTVVGSAMRDCLDAGTLGAFNAVHTESIQDAFRVVREQTAHALLLSPSVLASDQLPTLGRLVMKCPGVLAAAVIGEQEAVAVDRLLALGSYGVRRMFDLRSQAGWAKLRNMVAEAGGDTATEILRVVIPALGEATDGACRFFDTLVRVAPSSPTVKVLGRALGQHPSTVMSRFFRASLPSPKQYLAGTRLLYAVAFFQTPGRSIVDVVYRLEYSSPQSFGRHVRGVLGVTAGELRRDYPFAAVLAHFTGSLITPFEETFKWFDPLGRERPPQPEK